MRVRYLALLLGVVFWAAGCDEEVPVDYDDAEDDDTSDDDVGDDDVGDDDVGDDDSGDDDVGDDDVGDDDVGDDDTSDPDNDGDGFPFSNDCDDFDATVYPGAPEACDGKDTDCDGSIPADEDDGDADGWLVCEGDCNDGDPALNLDDADLDGYSTCDGDCNDGNGAINPLATDVVGDGIDQNCDGIDGTDGDGDGYAADWSGGDDCDDSDPFVNPGAPELCNDLDDNCDGNLSGPEVDDDGDGYDECMDGDCDDGNEDVYPGAPEICDGIEDNDCDGLTDPVDLDNDGDGWSECEGDCDDTDDLIAPDMNDDCFDGIDQDCSGGADEGCGVDNFTQWSNKTTDILWVIDNSCSMYDEQVNLGTESQFLFDSLNTAGIDFRIAVVTTDSEGFVGSPTVIDPSTPNPEAVFSASALVGTNGNYLEQGLLFGWNATVLAEAGTPPNDGFYRADAGLQVVFLSDEPDQSPDYQVPGWWQDYVDDFFDLKADPAMVHLNSIVATDGAVAVDCSGPGGYGYAGYGYVEAALATDGLLTSICDLDWSLLMNDLGTQSIEMATTFTLSYIAVPGTVEVWVNGIQWFSDWSYDPATNAIVFDIMNVPDHGDLIDVYYQY